MQAETAEAAPTQGAKQKDDEEKFTVREWRKYIGGIFWRPGKALLRWWLFPEGMGDWYRAYSQRVEFAVDQDTTKATVEFMRQLKNTMPQLSQLPEQIAQYFSQREGINNVGFIAHDPAEVHVYEVLISRADKLTVPQLNARMKKGLEALAVADLRALERAGLPSWVFAQMITATCGYNDPPKLAQEMIESSRILKAANGVPEVIDFLAFYDAWLRSGRAL